MTRRTFLRIGSLSLALLDPVRLRQAEGEETRTTMDPSKTDATGTGAPRWQVTWKGPTQAADAAREMARVMGRILGIEVPVAPWGGGRLGQTTFVITDASHAPPELARSLEGTRRDALRILYPAHLDGQRVCMLVAHDAAACDFAVYDFLTRYLGAEWVGPEDADEILPSQPDWKLPEAIDDTRNPDYEHRFWQSAGMNARRWLGHSFRYQFHHNLGNVFDPRKYGGEPELYPFYGGKRHIPEGDRLLTGWQPCTGTPRAVEIAAQYGLEYLRAHPDVLAFSLSVNDGGLGSCMCPRCQAQDAPHALDRGAPDLSDRYFRFYNAVIERVLEQRPDAYLAVLGYGRCKTPPTQVKVHPRVLVFNVCDNTNRQPDLVQRQRDWKAAGATPCLYQYLWDGGFLTVRHYPHALQEIIRLTRELGGTGYYCEDVTQWAAGGPKFYVLARLLWDTQSDVDALLDRYMRLAFGEAAAPAMRAYFDRWEEIWERGGKEVRHNTGRGWRSADPLHDLTRQDLAALDTAIERASAAPASPEQRRRIGYVHTFYRWLRINADQYLVARELADEAWLAARTPAEVLREAARGLSLTGAWEEMARNVIATDRTGWLFPRRHLNTPERYWQRLIDPIRREVLQAYEAAMDTAGDLLTRRMLTERNREGVVAFWQDQLAVHPMLAPWIRTQLYLLRQGPGPNRVVNGDFERGSAGTPPVIDGWTPFGAWQDLPAELVWGRTGGRNGSAGVGVGRGREAGFWTSVATRIGHRYRVSVWYRTEWPDERGAHHRVRWVVNNVVMFLPSTRGAWRHTSTTFTATAERTTLRLGANGQDTGEWTWYDDVELVEIGDAPAGER